MVTDFHVCLLLSPGCLLWSRLEGMSFSLSTIVFVYSRSTVNFCITRILITHLNSTSCWMLSSVVMFTMFVLEVINVYMVEFGCMLIEGSIVYLLLLCNELMCKSYKGCSTFPWFHVFICPCKNWIIMTSFGLNKSWLISCDEYVKVNVSHMREYQAIWTSPY